MRRLLPLLLLASLGSALLPAGGRAQEPAPPADQERDGEATRAARLKAAELDREVKRLLELGRSADALPLAEEALAVREKALGKDHPDIIASLNNVAIVASTLGDHPRAIALLERALALCRAHHGEDAAETGRRLGALAEIHWRTGDIARARALHERSLATLEKALGPDDLDVARALDYLSKVLLEQGERERAAEQIARMVAIREAKLGADHPEVASALSSLASLRLAQGDLASAGELFERALAIRERALGADHYAVSFTLQNLAVVASRRGDLRGALARHERALAIAERRLGPDDARLGRLLTNQGSVLAQLGRDGDARRLYERALAIVERHGGPDHPALVQPLGSLASLLRGAGDCEAALAHLRRAERIAVARFGAVSPAVAEIADGIATALFVQGDYDAALKAAERSLALHEEAHGARHFAVAESLRLLADVHDRRGDPARARRLLERALALDREVLGPRHPATGSVMASLARLARGRGELDEARALYEQVLAIWEASHGEESPRVAAACNNLAAVLHLTGDREGAEALYRRALAILSERLGADHPQLVEIRSNLALSLRERGEPEAACALYGRALGHAVAGRGSDHPIVATCLHNLAFAVERMAGAAAARPLLLRALAIREAALGADHPDVASTLGALGRLIDDPMHARPPLRRALAITSRNARRYLAGAPPGERVGLAASMRQAVDDWLGLTRATGEPAYDAVLSFKGVAADLGRSELRALRDADESARAKLAALRAARARLARLLTAGVRSRESAERYARAVDEHDRLGLELAELAGDAWSARAAPRPSDIVAQLGPGEALVDTFAYAGRHAAWVLLPDAEPRRIELGARAEVDRAARRFRDAVLAADVPDDPELVAAGAALRALVWEPIERALGDAARTVYLAPDEALAAVPMAALPGREAGTTLGEARAIVHVGSARDLLETEASAPPRRGRGALLLGAIDYGEGARGKLAALPGSGPEIDAVAARLRAAAPEAGVEVLRGAAGSESAFRRLASGRRLLHLATHGFIRHDLASALSGPFEEGAAPMAPDLERHLVGVDPMLLSGVALAGANGEAGAGEDDGVLTALEAASLDLAGVELVCLSACDTAGGVVRAGEGVLGLVRGFREAGARSVVASLWPVDDEASRRLMELFYERLLASPEGGERADAAAEARGLSPTAALREAALALRDVEVEVVDAEASLLAGRRVVTRERRFAAPRHWAAFVVYGR